MKYLKLRMTTYAEDVTPKELVKKLQDKHGVQKKMGGGIWGIVWVTAKGTVMKLTPDVREASIAASLKGKDNPYYANIYSVFKYPVKSKEYPLLYIIEKEYLADFTKDEMTHVNAACDIYSNIRRGWDISEKIQYYEEHDYFTKLIYKYIKQLEAIYDFFKKMKLPADDIHANNMGKKPDGSLAGFDFREYDSKNDGRDKEMITKRVESSVEPLAEKIMREALTK